MRFMFSQHPAIADRWKGEQEKSMGKKSFKKLPKRVKGSKATPAKTRKATNKSQRKKKK